MDQTLLPHNNRLWGKNGFISEHAHTHTHTHIIMFYSPVTQWLSRGKMNFITEHAHTHKIIMFYSTVTQQLLWGKIGTELARTHTLLVVQILLKELEDFAFKGIPDVRGCHSQDAQLLEEMVSVNGSCSCWLCLSLFVVCILCLSLFVVVCLSL